MEIKKTKLFLAFLVVISLTSCIIDTAKTPSKQNVTLYSDCIRPKDIRFFKKFQKTEHIKVRIVYLPTDSILSKIKKQGYNSQADIIILKSLFGIYKADKSNLLQPWTSDKIKETIIPKYKSTNNTWFGIGIDPYVFVAKNDSLANINSIGDLLYPKVMDKWSSNLEKSGDLVPLLAPILKRKTRLGAKDWFIDFKRNQHSQLIETDKNNIPIMTTDVLLTNYASYLKMSERNDSSDLLLQLTFTNQTKKGAFFNLYCAGIVKQAKNYTNAKLLIEYITSPIINEKLNNEWKSFPISLHNKIHPYAYQNTYFKIAQIKSERMMANYGHLDKIIQKNKLK